MTGLGLLTRGMLGGASGPGPNVYVLVPVGRLRGKARGAVGRFRAKLRGVAGRLRGRVKRS